MLVNWSATVLTLAAWVVILAVPQVGMMRRAYDFARAEGQRVTPGSPWVFFALRLRPLVRRTAIVSVVLYVAFLLVLRFAWGYWEYLPVAFRVVYPMQVALTWLGLSVLLFGTCLPSLPSRIYKHPFLHHCVVIFSTLVIYLFGADAILDETRKFLAEDARGAVPLARVIHLTDLEQKRLDLMDPLTFIVPENLPEKLRPWIGARRVMHEYSAGAELKYGATVAIAETIHPSLWVSPCSEYFLESGEYIVRESYYRNRGLSGGLTLEAKLDALESVLSFPIRAGGEYGGVYFGGFRVVLVYWPFFMVLFGTLVALGSAARVYYKGATWFFGSHDRE